EPYSAYRDHPAFPTRRSSDLGTSLERMARSSAPVFFKPQAVAAKRNPRGKEASEGACFINGTSVCLARRSRKGPPILRNRSEGGDRKSTRLNSSHVKISYAVF